MIVILGSLYAVCAEDGEPVVWQTDNTGSVKNDRVEFDPVTSVAARRGISIVHNIPGNSQANGIAENFNKYLDERAKELATYQGKGMDSLAHKRVHKITQKMVKAQAVGDNDEVARLKAEAERAGCGLVFGSYAEAVDWVKRVVMEFNDMPHRELAKIADQVTVYLNYQIENGAQAVQLFDTWAGALAPADYREIAAPYTRRVIEGLKRAGVPVILYINGGGHLLDEMATLGADVLSLDWRTDMAAARRKYGATHGLQGNLDPCALYGTEASIRREVQRVLDAAGPVGHIFNLGHGITPDADPDNVTRMIAAVRG
ncbi:MAG: hypothetical protein AUK60_07705 [Rhodobacteraceae bacterium CG2_30_10_405]|nr:MAG: hypothetical protein AUK60_07705 [Rhodobacteraceae bacterium CG2_30_10_405]